MRDRIGEVGDVGHRDRVREEAEHRLVVRRVADEGQPVAPGLQVDGELLAHQAPRHRQLVVGAEPGVDVDRAHLHRQAVAVQQVDHLLHRRLAERRHVLAPVDGQVGLAVALVGGECRAAHLAQHFLADLGQAGAVLLALRVVARPGTRHAARRVVVAEVEGAVLADHGRHRPEARDQVAPAGRPSGHRHHVHAGRLQPLHRKIGRGAEAAAAGHRAVDVAQQRVDARRRRLRPRRSALHSFLPQ